MLKGPDLSKWQGNIDFAKMKNDVDFVILRSSYGVNSIDGKFLEYASECKRVEIPILGVYHFCYARSNEMAIQEAKHCMSVVEKAGLDKDILIFYDLEYDSVAKAAKYGVTLSSKAINEYTAAFCDTVKQAGYRPGVYFNKDYYRTKYDKAVLGRYTRWLADYQSQPTYDCEIQQVSSDHQLNGVYGNVDWNYLWNEGLLIQKDEPIREEVVVKSLASEWSKEARDFCIKNGIFKGDGNGEYDWTAPLTREQAAQLFYNYVKNNSK